MGNGKLKLLGVYTYAGMNMSVHLCRIYRRTISRWIDGNVCADDGTKETNEMDMR